MHEPRRRRRGDASGRLCGVRILIHIPCAGVLANLEEAKVSQVRSMALDALTEALKVRL